MKTNLDSFFKADDTLEKEGSEFALNDKIKFRLLRFHQNNPKIKAAFARHYKPYARQMEMGTLPQEKSDEISIRVFIETSLVGWEGVEDGEGNPIPFTSENALNLLKSMPELFTELWKHANTFSNYQAHDVGNS